MSNFHLYLSKFLKSKYNCIYYFNTTEIPGELFHVNMISSHMKIMLFSEVKRSALLYGSIISCTVLRCVPVQLKHHRFFFRNIQLASEIFGNLQKFLENVRERLSGLQTTFGESLEIFRKCLEIFEKLSKSCH